MDSLIPKSETFARFESYTRELQDRIVTALGEVESTPFERKDWTRAEGGGGHMATVRGDIIEKGAVLVSSVHGSSRPQAALAAEEQDARARASSPLTQKPFLAAGLSLIIHPADPHAPTVHLNVRRFEEADDAWWGGGMDLTPMGVRHEDDVEHFHRVLKKALGADHEAGKAEADRYFYVPHRHRARGAGGVFYDRVSEPTDRLARAIGDHFLDAYLPILKKRVHAPFTQAEREQQLRDRGVYVEFNLLYDRGTRFGFQSGGHPEAILASLPPLVRW